MPIEKEILHYPVMRHVSDGNGGRKPQSKCNCGHALPCPDMPVTTAHDAQKFIAPPIQG